MGNEFLSAMGELQQCFDQELGEAQFVHIDGKKYPAIIGDVTSDVIVSAGGVVESGGFTCMVSMAFLRKRPEQGTEIKGRGMILDILTTANINNATWQIVAGEMASE